MISKSNAKWKLAHVYIDSSRNIQWLRDEIVGLNKKTDYAGLRNLGFKGRKKVNVAAPPRYLIYLIFGHLTF